MTNHNISIASRFDEKKKKNHNVSNIVRANARFEKKISWTEDNTPYTPMYIYVYIIY